MSRYEELMDQHDYYITETIKASKGKLAKCYEKFRYQFQPSTKVSIFKSIAEECKQKALRLTIAEAMR